MFLFKKWVLVVISSFLICSGSSCSDSNLPKPEQPTQSLPVPTQSIEPTNPTLPVTLGTPTKVKESTEIGTIQTPFVFILSTELFESIEGLFSFYPPLGWEKREDEIGAVWFESLDNLTALKFEITNTGYELNGRDFENFINARDKNLFSIYEEYHEVNRDIKLENRKAIITKKLAYDGQLQTVVSIYHQDNETILAQDFWVNEKTYELNIDEIENFFNNININKNLAANLPHYAWIMDFIGPDSLYSVNVPISWTYEHTTGDFTAIDAFNSPDENAIIQNIIYDDGNDISQLEAAALALELLRNFYGEDIKITEDRIQPDGSERLAWFSLDKNLTGLSFFETRGTIFLLFNAVYENSYRNYYIDSLNYAVSTYKAP
jgi:hypothetical protein